MGAVGRHRDDAVGDSDLTAIGKVEMAAAAAVMVVPIECAVDEIRIRPQRPDGSPH